VLLLSMVEMLQCLVTGGQSDWRTRRRRHIYYNDWILY